MAGSDADLKAARGVYADIDKTFAGYGVYPDDKGASSMVKTVSSNGA